MPTATKHSTILEESHLAAACDRTTDGGQMTGRLRPPSPPTLDIKLFEEIKKLMDDAKRYEEQEREAKRKIEKYNSGIEAAEEMITKAKIKKEGLQLRNEFLRNCLDDLEYRKNQALKYWEDFGIDVKQVSTEDNDFQQFEFNYTKLHKSSDSGECSVNLKHHAKRLEIVEHFPEILSANLLNDLNERLTKSCVNDSSGVVDYRLAMILIKKELVKASNSSRPSQSK